MRKNILTIFLLTVLTIQVLPIRQMGSLLFSNQFTEELPHSMDDVCKCCKNTGLKSDFLYTPVFNLGSSFIYLNTQHPELIISIPANHTGDIHVPPPNC